MYEKKNILKAWFFGRILLFPKTNLLFPVRGYPKFEESVENPLTITWKLSCDFRIINYTLQYMNERKSYHGT